MKASLNSVHGRVESEWTRKGKSISLDITIPANSKATLYLSADKGKIIPEKDIHPEEKYSFVRSKGIQNGLAVYEVEAGTYRFTIR